MQDEIRKLRTTIAKTADSLTRLKRQPGATPMEIATLVLAAEKLDSARRLLWTIKD